MDFDSTSRAFTYVGDMNFVNVEYSVSFDSMGLASNMPCWKNLTLKYDQCVYEKVHAESPNYEHV